MLPEPSEEEVLNKKHGTDVVVLVAAVVYCLVGIVLGLSGNLTEAALRILVPVGAVCGFVILTILRQHRGGDGRSKQTHGT